MSKRSTFVLALASMVTVVACGAENDQPAPAEQPTAPEVTPTTAAKPIRASTVAADLAAVNIDYANEPSLHDLVARLKTEEGHERLRVLMRSFTKSLGVRCSDCHSVVGGDGRPDFAADTPEKRVANGMWNEFVAKLRLKDGSPLFCDSCHQGKEHFLDRTNPAQVRAFMSENFAGKLVTKANDTVRCDTCHGEPFQPAILERWEATPEFGSGG